jgi:hypothetical protein
VAEALFAEYGAPAALAAAIENLRERGYRELDAYSPYGDPGVERALGRPRSRLPLATFAAGASGAGLAYFVQWLVAAYLYPLNVGGRPMHMPLTFVVITFEMGVLAAGFAVFVGVILKARLLRLYDPIFEVHGIERASVDRHWLRLDESDPMFDREQASADLRATAPLRVFHHPGDDR